MDCRSALGLMRVVIRTPRRADAMHLRISAHILFIVSLVGRLNDFTIWQMQIRVLLAITDLLSYPCRRCFGSFGRRIAARSPCLYLSFFQRVQLLFALVLRILALILIVTPFDLFTQLFILAIAIPLILVSLLAQLSLLMLTLPFGGLQRGISSRLITLTLSNHCHALKYASLALSRSSFSAL